MWLLEISKVDGELAYMCAGVVRLPPPRSKKQTRAQAARSRGLAPLAKLLEQLGGPGGGSRAPEAAAGRFVGEAKGVQSVEEAPAALGTQPWGSQSPERYVLRRGI